MGRGQHAWIAALAMAVIGAAAVASAQTKAPAKGAPAAPAAPAAGAATEKIDTLKRIRETGTILIGVREASVPFSFLDAQKQPQGYSVDVCLKVVDAIKSELKMPRLEIKFVPVSSANRIPALLAQQDRPRVRLDDQHA